MPVTIIIISSSSRVVAEVVVAFGWANRIFLTYLSSDIMSFSSDCQKNAYRRIHSVIK